MPQNEDGAGDSCGECGEEGQTVNETRKVDEIPLLPDFVAISRTDVASLVWPRGTARASGRRDHRDESDPRQSSCQ
jgi:hypothetical protein